MNLWEYQIKKREEITVQPNTDTKDSLIEYGDIVNDFS